MSQFSIQKHFIQENIFEKVVSKMAAILDRPKRDNLYQVAPFSGVKCIGLADRRINLLALYFQLSKTLY